MIFLSTCSVMTTSQSSPVQELRTHINRTQTVVLMSDILLQLTTHANRDVFKIISLFGNKIFHGFMMVVEMRVVFWICCTVAFCCMSLQYPCELLYRLKMEAVHHLSKTSEQRKKTFHNVKPQKTKVTFQINLHV